jgi:hypothetical protein
MNTLAKCAETYGIYRWELPLVNPPAGRVEILKCDRARDGCSSATEPGGMARGDRADHLGPMAPPPETGRGRIPAIGTIRSTPMIVALFVRSIRASASPVRRHDPSDRVDRFHRDHRGLFGRLVRAPHAGAAMGRLRRPAPSLRPREPGLCSSRGPTRSDGDRGGGRRGSRASPGVSVSRPDGPRSSRAATRACPGRRPPGRPPDRRTGLRQTGSARMPGQSTNPVRPDEVSITLVRERSFGGPSGSNPRRASPALAHKSLSHSNLSTVANRIAPENRLPIVCQELPWGATRRRFGSALQPVETGTLLHRYSRAI